MRKTSSLLTILLATAALAACASAPKDAAGPQANAVLPTSQWDSQVGIKEVPHAISLGVHDDGLSAVQTEVLSGLIDSWAADDGGAISVTYGPGGAAPLVATQAADYLRAQGVPQVDLAPAKAGLPGDTVQVQYLSAEAMLPLCGQRIGNYLSNESNGVDQNFGCAVTANLAAQAADPRDLQRPRAATQPDAARAGVIVGKYENGVDTTSASPAGFGSSSGSSSSSSSGSGS